MNPEDDRGLFSRLPTDPAYWDRLAGRITTGAATQLDARRTSNRVWWSPLSRFSPLLAATAAAAVVATVSLLPDTPAARLEGDRHTDAFGLSPSDPIAAPLLATGAPPAVATLLALGRQEEVR